MKGLDLTKIFDSMKDNEISELIIKEGSRIYEIRRGGFKQKIVAGAAQAPVVAQMPHQATVMPQAVQQPVQNTSIPSNSVEAKTNTEDKASSSDLYEFKSPLVGTFYASPKPDAPAFVEVGDKVKKGQVLCIVEAMKTFNEIECDVDGVIKEICVSNQDLVEFGKVLFKIEQ